MSRSVTVTIAHDLGREEARRRVEAGFADISPRVEGLGRVVRTWNGDRLAFRFSAVGQSIDGVIDVADRTVRLEVILPGLLAMVAGRLEGRLQQEGRLLLGKK